MIMGVLENNLDSLPSIKTSPQQVKTSPQPVKLLTKLVLNQVSSRLLLELV